MSSTAVAKLPKVPPSSFSVLLRRSKFASYDPQIGQIYTTYGGSAHRGDWGLKRPLAVRRRDGRLIINSIDTLYQQTEWTSAYSDATALRRFEEMGVIPKLGAGGEWERRLGVRGRQRQLKWMHDSDYAMVSREKTTKDLEVLSPVPDPQAMAPKRFERYLRKLRRLAPEFREFIEAEEEKRAGQSGPNAKRVQQMAASGTERVHLRFLGTKFMEACRAENSTVIRPMPHPTGGLTYICSTDLQAAIDGKPIPGRRLHYGGDRENPRYVNVGLGGWVVQENVTVPSGKSVTPVASMTDFGTKEGEPRTNPEAGKDVFRPTECWLASPPEVVGKNPQRMEHAGLIMKVMSWSDVDSSRENPHKPGTVEYIKKPQEKAKHPIVRYTAATMTRAKSTRGRFRKEERVNNMQPSAVLRTMKMAGMNLGVPKVDGRSNKGGQGS